MISSNSFLEIFAQTTSPRARTVAARISSLISPSSPMKSPTESVLIRAFDELYTSALPSNMIYIPSSLSCPYVTISCPEGIRTSFIASKNAFVPSLMVPLFVIWKNSCIVVTFFNRSISMCIPLYYFHSIVISSITGFEKS